MAESSNPVSAAISAASSTLSRSFGVNVDVEGADEFRYLQEEELIDLYKTELEEKNLSAFF